MAYLGDWTTNRKFWEPAAAAGVSITPNAVAYADSAWVHVFTADADCVLTDYLLTEVGAIDVPVQIEAGYSTNGGSSYTAIDSQLFIIRDLNNHVTTGRICLARPVDGIPSGALVGLRMRKGGTSTTAWRFKVGYMKKPLAGTVDTTALPGVAVPANAALFTVTSHSTTPWEYGTPVNLLTAPSDIEIRALCVPRFFQPDFELKFMRNGAAIDYFRGSHGVAGTDVHHIVLRNPLRGVMSGDVLSVAMRAASTSYSVYVGLVYAGID